MSDRRPMPIPEDLADIPPGPRLVTALAGIDLARLSGFDCVEVLKARYRQLNHDRAQLMVAMVEVGLCGPGPDDLARMAAPDEFSADEIRTALGLTRRAADHQFWLAHDLLARLPEVHAALDSGRLDEPRARVLSEWTADLTAEQARAICTALLPRIPRLTTGQLVEQVKKMAIAIDPDWARRRYEHAVADRKVVGYRNPDGSANLSGLNLPVDRVAAASGRINALAKAAKHTGDSRPIDHIRADLFLGMTDGTYTGLDDAAILAHLRTTTRTTTNDDGPGAAGAGMELRVRLSTLLGHDEYPGELAGWGPVHADLARDLTTALACGQWRFAITDGQGRLLHSGITPARPTGSPPRSARSRQIVELQIPAATLHDLTSHPDGTQSSWAPVLADLAHRYVTERQPPAEDPTRRLPGTALRRHVQIRDRSCIMVGCRAPARSTDADHTVDHARGGATTGSNLGATCRHDHRLKHEGGWQLHQPEPGEFHWISRLGHHYRTRTPPIIDPLPDPLPRPGPAPPLYTRPDDGWERTSIWHGPTPQPSATPPSRPPPHPGSPDDDPPPF